MSPPATEAPTLFPIAVADNRGRSLEAVVLEVLSGPEDALCPVCDACMAAIRGGVRCVACGTEILAGAEPEYAWAA